MNAWQGLDAWERLEIKNVCSRTLELDNVHVLNGHKMWVGFSVDSIGGRLLLIHKLTVGCISLDVIRIRDGIWFTLGCGPVASGRLEDKGLDARKKAPGTRSQIAIIRSQAALSGNINRVRGTISDEGALFLLG